MKYYAYDVYSGYLEDTISIIGSRDVTQVERFHRLRDHMQRSLGLSEELTFGWEESVESLIMDPPASVKNAHQALGMLGFLWDNGQRRFRIIVPERDDNQIKVLFDAVGKGEYFEHFVNSAIGDYRSTFSEFSWGFLDIEETQAMLDSVFGDRSYEEKKTAAIAGRLAHMSRDDAEQALSEVGIDTQNSVSHNIDYLIVGSKGTGGNKHERVQKLIAKGHQIKVLDEAGFDALLSVPKAAPPSFSTEQREQYEELVRALRHVWAFDLDLYCISYLYDPALEW